jgi:hypothetical protein
MFAFILFFLNFAQDSFNPLAFFFGNVFSQYYADAARDAIM